MQLATLLVLRTSGGVVHILTSHTCSGSKIGHFKQHQDHEYRHLPRKQTVHHHYATPSLSVYRDPEATYHFLWKARDKGINHRSRKGRHHHAKQAFSSRLKLNSFGDLWKRLWEAWYDSTLASFQRLFLTPNMTRKIPLYNRSDPGALKGLCFQTY